MKLTVYCAKDIALENPYIVFTWCNTINDLISKEFMDFSPTQRRELWKINQNYNFKYKIFVKTTSPKNPKWWELIYPALEWEDKTKNPLSNTCSWIILIKCAINLDSTGAEKLFIITFWSAFTYLENSAFVEKFWLKTLLNIVSLKDIQLVDKKNIGSNTKQQKDGFAIPTNIKNFWLDQLVDKLTCVSGLVEQEYQDWIGDKLVGRDSVSIDRNLQFWDLWNLCRSLYNCYTQNNYQTKWFWFIDNFTDRLEREEKTRLQNLLWEALRNNDRRPVFSPKNIIDSIENITQYRIIIGWDSQIFSLDSVQQIYDFIFWERRTRISNLGDFIQRVKIQWVDSDENPINNKTSLFDYIIFEVFDNNQQYVLHEGTWYRVNNQYYQDINGIIQDYVNNKMLDIVYQQSVVGESEWDYNDRQWRQPHFYCIDKNLFRWFDTAIEVWDLIYYNQTSQECHLIHIKKWNKSSSLSHLFAQWKVSYEALVDSSEYRHNFEVCFRNGFEGIECPSTSRIITVFWMISQIQNLNWLPFFSKVNLISVVRHIEKIWWNVKFVLIPIN